MSKQHSNLRWQNPKFYPPLSPRFQNTCCTAISPVSVNGNFFSNLRLETLEMFLTPLFLLQLRSNLEENLFGSTFKIYPKSSHSPPPSCQNICPTHHYCHLNYCRLNTAISPRRSQFSFHFLSFFCCFCFFISPVYYQQCTEDYPVKDLGHAIFLFYSNSPMAPISPE